MSAFVPARFEREVCGPCIAVAALAGSDIELTCCNPRTECLCVRVRTIFPWHLQMVHFERMPARQAKFAEPARPLSAASRRALDARGVKSLFLHQAKVCHAE